MLLSRFFGRQEVSNTSRPRPRRRPQLEALEGRRLLSSFGSSDFVVGSHIGSNIVGQHIGTNIVGQHIGTNIVGQHIGTFVVQGRKH